MEWIKNKKYAYIIAGACIIIIGIIICVIIESNDKQANNFSIEDNTVVMNQSEVNKNEEEKEIIVHIAGIGRCPALRGSATQGCSHRGAPTCGSGRGAPLVLLLSGGHQTKAGRKPQRGSRPVPALPGHRPQRPRCTIRIGVPEVLPQRGQSGYRDTSASSGTRPQQSQLCPVDGTGLPHPQQVRPGHTRSGTVGEVAEASLRRALPTGGTLQTERTDRQGHPGARPHRSSRRTDVADQSAEVCPLSGQRP